MEQAVLWGIMLLVLIGIPVLLGRKSGKSPMEIIFGSRVKGTAFEKKETGAGEKEKAAAAREKNSGREDLLATVSDLVSYARRNHFALLVPGTIQAGGKTANLAAILLTRGRVVGINCFGYGGSIQAYPGEANWTQTQGGKKKSFDSPVAKNRLQEEILREALKEAGFGETPAEVLGVFTASSAVLKSAGKTSCFTREALRTKLSEDRYLKDEGLDPEKLRAALDGKILRVNGKK